jgi:hypothetical protein
MSNEMSKKTTGNGLYIVVDFDGTCVTHEYPRVGRDIGAQAVLKELVEAGHKLILFTMRCDKTKMCEVQRTVDNMSIRITEPVVINDSLTQAVKWFKDNDIELFGIQTNPTQAKWTDSPKAYGHIIIDDAALGCPLIKGENGERDYVDWQAVREMLFDMDIL